MRPQFSFLMLQFKQNYSFVCAAKTCVVPAMQPLRVLTVLILCAISIIPVHAESWLRETFRNCPENKTVSLIPSNTNAVTIDEEGGIIRVVNNSTGKPIVTVFRIYSGRGGVEFFAHQRTVGNGNECTFRSRTRIYSIVTDTSNTSKWVDITYQILPKLKLSDFYGKRGPKMQFDVDGVLSSTQEHSTAGDGVAIHYGIPNFGNRIFARLLPQCGDGKKENLPEYENIFEKAEFSLIELLWNMEENKFEIDVKK
jgi:hypothetical protein